MFYCSSVLAVATKKIIERLQKVQNFAVRIVTGERKFDDNHALFERSTLGSRCYATGGPEHYYDIKVSGLSKTFLQQDQRSTKEILETGTNCMYLSGEQQQHRDILNIEVFLWGTVCLRTFGILAH